MTQARDDRWIRLEEALAARDIDPDAFERQAVHAVEETWRSPGTTDPGSTFTADETTLLEYGGFDLAPLGVGEPDIVLRTATSLALVEVKAASVLDVAAALNVTRARVRQRATERTLYAIRVDDEWRFPDWQFDADGRPWPGLSTVVPAVPAGVHPVAVERFMTEPNPDLEVLEQPASPLQWLGSGGDPEKVAAIAREL